MGVLTTFYRVPTSMYDRVLDDPDLVDAMEEDAAEAPPSMSVDKAWQEIRLLLSAAGHTDAAGIFDDATELETGGGVEVQALSADVVQELAPLLAAIALDGVAKAAIESEDYEGFRKKPWDAEYAAGALRGVVELVAAAAAAREAILITTS
jgi:hypothetical protein